MAERFIVQLPYREASSFLLLWFEAHYETHYMVNPHAFSFYTFAKFIQPLAELDGNAELSPLLLKRMGDVNLLADWFGIEPFCKKYLPSSGQHIRGIGNNLKETFLEPKQSDPAPLMCGGRVITDYWAGRLREDIQKFETVLQDEVSKLPIFCCDDDAIGNFSIAKLLKGASNGYPDKTKKRLTADCCREIDEAGRCLVYERSTASGFHILRSVELTIRQYLSAVPGFVMPPLNRQNWGEYLALLKTNGAARDVTDHLHNIKDNYRNPLMHPEDVLETDEAVSLFAVAQSMNEMLINDILKRGFIK